MEDRLVAYHQRKERMLEYKEAAAKGCYSLILIVVTLMLLRPVMVSQMLGLANAYTGAGLLDESMRQCEKALLIDNDSGEAWRQSARIYRIRGDREMAYGAYLEAVRADSSNRMARLEVAGMYIEDDRHSLAIPYLEQVRKLGPDQAAGRGAERGSCHRVSLELLIQCYEKAGDSVGLEMILKEARIFYPNYARTASTSAQPTQTSAGGS